MSFLFLMLYLALTFSRKGCRRVLRITQISCHFKRCCREQTSKKSFVPLCVFRHSEEQGKIMVIKNNDEENGKFMAIVKLCIMYPRDFC